MSQERLNEELATLEAALARLSPMPSGVGRDRLMFLAGRASARSRARRRRVSWLWPCATAASFLLAVTFGGLLLLRGEPQVQERIVYVEASGTPTKPHGNEAISVARREARVTRHRPRTGSPDLPSSALIQAIDALPELRPAPGREAGVPCWPPRSRKEMEQLFGG